MFTANNSFACAACAGASDSDLAKGMNWGIFTLLIVVTCVLGGIAAFFIYLIKKSATSPALLPADAMPQTTQKI